MRKTPYILMTLLMMPLVAAQEATNTSILLKIGLLITILILVQKKVINKDLAIIAGIIILITFFIPLIPATDTQSILSPEQIIVEPQQQSCENYDPVCFGDITYKNMCEAEEAEATNKEECIPILAIPESQIEQIFSTTINLGPKVSKRFPLAGWFLVFLALFLLIGLIKLLGNARDNIMFNWLKRR